MRFATLLAAVCATIGVHGAAVDQIALHNSVPPSTFTSFDNPVDSYCTRFVISYQFLFQIYTNNFGQDVDGCGKGLLDNLRGYCGVINNWGCDLMPDNCAYSTFITANSILAGCVERAIYAASPSDNRATGI